jgi:hypothetical protein
MRKAMGCNGCSNTDLGAKLGNCAFCVRVAAISSFLFWGLYVATRRWPAVHILQWPALLFAALVTLMLVAHILAYLGRPGAKHGDRSS